MLSRCEDGSCKSRRLISSDGCRSRIERMVVVDAVFLCFCGGSIRLGTIGLPENVNVLLRRRASASGEPELSTLGGEGLSGVEGMEGGTAVSATGENASSSRAISLKSEVTESLCLSTTSSPRSFISGDRRESREPSPLSVAMTAGRLNPDD